MASLRRHFTLMQNGLGWVLSTAWRCLRWFALFFLAGSLALWIACVWIDRWISGADGNAFVVNILRDATGADVKLEAIKSNLPHRLALSGLELKMPMGKGLYEKSPSVVLKHADYHIAFSKLLYGTFELSNLLIDGLEISGERRDGRLWIAGMLEHLEAKKASQPVEAEPVEEKEPMTLEKLRGLFAKIFIPMRVVIGEVGVKNLVLHFRDIQKNVTTTELHLGPTHALVGAKAWMAKSNVWADIGGDQADNYLDFTLKIAKKAPIHKKVKTNIHLNIENLKKLDFLTNIDGTPVPFESKISLLLSDSLSELEIMALDVSAGKILNQHGQGTIRILDDALRKFFINFADELSLNLNQVNEVLPSTLDVKVGGNVQMKRLAVRGNLDLDSFKDLAQAITPNVELDLLLAEISARTKMAGILGFGGKVNIKTKTLNEGGIDLTNDIDLRVARMNVSAPGVTGTTKAVVENFVLHTIAELSRVTSTQDVAIDRLKIDVAADRIAVTPPGKTAVSVPLKANIEADSKIAAMSGRLDVVAQLGSLLKAAVSAKCGIQCEQASTDMKISISKIEDIFELVRPLLPPTSTLPELKKGKLDVNLQANLVIPMLKDATLATRIKSVRPQVNSKTTLIGLGVSMPAQKIKVEGIDVLVTTKGDLKTQKITTEIAVERVEAAKLPEPLYKTKFEMAMNAEKDGAVTVDKFLLAIPGVGSTLAMTAKTEIGADQMPQNLHLALNLEVNPESVKVVPKLLKLTGTSKIDVNVDAPDLSQLQVKGNVGFANFGVELKEVAENGEEKNLVVVENLRGNMPFQQLVNVKDIISAKKPEPLLVVKTAIKKTFDQKLDQYLEKYSAPVSAGGSRMTTEYYGEMRPLYKGRTPITIERIQFRELKFEQMEIDAELKQNQFSLNQLVIGVLGGKVQGGMQASFDTKLREVRFAGQWTRLDTRKLAENFPKLQARTKGFSVLASSPYIDGTLRLKYDAVSGDIAGGMEITSIGKEQLKMIFLYLDPDDKNPTIVSIRKALNIGEVRQVSVPIRNGQIGVDVDVRVFSAPIPTPKLQRFPLAQLVRNFTAGAPADKAQKESEVIK